MMIRLWEGGVAGNNNQEITAFADNNDGNSSRITKMGNNNSSTSEGSTNHKENLSPGNIWYEKFTVVQQHQVEMDVNAVLYAGCMAAAQQILDTRCANRRLAMMMFIILMIM